MRPQDIISKKRDGKRLSEQEISAFISGVTDGSWADYQISALIMAMYLHELDADEQSAITQAMLHSGEVLDFSHIKKPKVDKHSTGGVGDKTSLIIAPLAAACGLAVPMISGRGLGHTGGTLDKLESIAGFNVNLSISEFKRIVDECGYAMTGQTDEIVPADKKIYALRDATATVSTIPLIVASIMSKKLAEGLDALVLDVKTGNGAFMSDFEQARRLATAMVKTGNACGVKTNALITDMSQPLGKFVGNALEVFECIKILRDETSHQMKPTRALSVELTAQILVSSGTSKTLESAKILANEKLAGGHAFETFSRNLDLQGGDTRVCENPDILIDPDLTRTEIKSLKSGFVDGVNTMGIGNAICGIGGGRFKADDAIDPAVGYASEVKIGQGIRVGEVLGILFCRDQNQADSISSGLQSAYAISDDPPTPPNLIKEIIS